MLDFVDKNKQDRLEASLKEALSSLDAVNSGQLAKLVGERVAAFANYQQLKTLKEVWTPSDRNAAADMIRNLLESQKSVAAKKAEAERLLDLFSKLQNRALKQFQQPTKAAMVL